MPDAMVLAPRSPLEKIVREAAQILGPSHSVQFSPRPLRVGGLIYRMVTFPTFNTSASLDSSHIFHISNTIIMASKDTKAECKDWLTAVLDPASKLILSSSSPLPLGGWQDIHGGKTSSTTAAFRGQIMRASDGSFRFRVINGAKIVCAGPVITTSDNLLEGLRAVYNTL